MVSTIILTCPKCQSQHQKVDNFCIECGNDLKNKLRKINLKNKINKK